MRIEIEKIRNIGRYRYQMTFYGRNCIIASIIIDTADLYELRRSVDDAFGSYWPALNNIKDLDK